jgi:hypothetical protein
MDGFVLNVATLIKKDFFVADVEAKENLLLGLMIICGTVQSVEEPETLLSFVEVEVHQEKMLLQIH